MAQVKQHRQCQFEMTSCNVNGETVKLFRKKCDALHCQNSERGLLFYLTRGGGVVSYALNK
jgi:hypothetical protein